MKLAMLTPSISRQAGGLRDCVLNLARSLEKKHDVRVEVLSVEDEFAAADRPLWDPLSVHLARPKFASFRYAPELSRNLSTANLDLVHTHGLWTYLSIATLRWSQKRAKPYVITPHGMLDPWALRNSQWKKRIASFLFEWRHLTGAACLHAINRPEAAAMRDFGLKNPICVIPNGVEIPDSTSKLQPPEWGTEVVPGRKVLLYLGRLHPKKGLPTLLRSWREAISKNGDWILVIAGWDQSGHRSELEQLVAQLGISDSVKFVGPLFGGQRDAAYQSANAFVLPSLSEGQPLAVLEAWSHALPVIMTRECNLGEGFEIGAAIRMEPTVASGIDAMETLFSLGDAALREMGMCGKRLVATSFSWPQIAAQMFSVYQWVTGSGPAPSSLLSN
jgi:poly(glycerol-phosphate) alpha-glucosyltransferase